MKDLAQHLSNSGFPMKNLSLISTAAVVSLLSTGVASAQATFDQGTAFGRTNQVDDLSDDLRDEIEDDAERDIDRFGNEGSRLGFSGSLALRAAATTGNDETVNLGVAGNAGYFDGLNGYDFALYYRYAESEDEDGDTNTDEDRLLYDFQYTRSFTDEFYGFAKLQGTYNGDAGDDNDVLAERENDIFLGFGVGYRFLNTPTIQWSLQAGPGYRFANFSDIGDTVTSFDDDDINEAAFSITSNYSNRVSETVSLTNDTDIITSDFDTVFYNDLAVNVALSNALALRTSLLSEYHTERAPGEEATDHSLGVSLVYSFN